MSTSPLDRKLLDDVIAIAHRAGEIIERVRAEGFDVVEKGGAGPVTRADREADALLHDELLKLVPAAWLSEETADDGSRLGADTLWVVDPLDGTKEFVEGVPHYTVAIGLVDAEGPALGVVYNPARGETFAAIRGGGALFNGEPMHVAEGKVLGASRSEMKRGEFTPFEKEWDVQAIGSIEYKLALVASGAIAATVSRGPKHEWDVCAGACLVAEAGGRVTDAFGDVLRWNQSFPKSKGVLAGLPKAWERVREVISSVGMSDRMDEVTGR